MASSAPEPLSARGKAIVAAARELLEEEGLEALSMRRLAERLGIRAPSIYKHLPDKRALENAVISAGFEEQAELFERAAFAPALRPRLPRHTRALMQSLLAATDLQDRLNLGRTFGRAAE